MMYDPIELATIGDRDSVLVRFGIGRIAFGGSRVQDTNTGEELKCLVLQAMTRSKPVGSGPISDDLIADERAIALGFSTKESLDLVIQELCRLRTEFHDV